ncbi:MAG: carboxypeptidase-like regulatory domain-containing protein [Spirosoma sp.]|nr:carboxypeptidase-like regulatory domain-containing protein [Spirosoma sp.]
MRICSTILLWLVAYCIYAQPIPNVAVRGTVVDSSMYQPLPWATALRSLTDSSIHRITLANAQGTFVFRGIARGRYRLTVSCVGYTKISQPVNVSPIADLTLDIGTFALPAQTVRLSEVRVRRPPPVTMRS